MRHTSPADERSEWRIATLVFGALVVLSAWCISRGWASGNLPGHEFRQTQTALSALFIQRDGNFSPAYPTPILGAPWSTPMEFPLYQWMAVVVSNASGWPLVQSGRAVSMFWLYVALAALWPLLGRLGLPPSRRLVAMGLVLTCPLYLFYARAFLIETAGLALALWFLVAFMRFIEGERWKGRPVVGALGVAAGLVKITTFAVFLIPAGWLTLLEMNRARARGTWPALQVGWWAVLAIAVPVAATAWWTHYADVVKTANFSAHFLRSADTRTFMLGTAENRFAAETLAGHWRNLKDGIASPVLLVAALALGCTLGRSRWREMVFCTACYLIPLAIFPTLYAWHNYYGVANAVLLLAALGVAVSAALDLRRKWLAWGLVLGLHFAQLWLYRENFYPMQDALSPGGSDMTKAVRKMTNPGEAIVVAGFDWDSSLAFYSQRRALMIRLGMERDWTYLNQAYQAQGGQDFSVYIARGKHRDDPTMLRLLDQYFRIDPRPIFRWTDVTVYGRRDRRVRMVDAVRRNLPQLSNVVLDPATESEQLNIVNREVRLDEILEDQQEPMSLFSPRPWKFFHQFGSALAEEEKRRLLVAHPNTRFWFHSAPGMNRVRVEFCVLAGAYADTVPAPDRTDGVEFFVEREAAGGARQRLASVFLNPAQNTKDRGFHVMEVPVLVGQGESIVVGNNPGPYGSLARDWAGFSSIRITPAP